jgi:uncharacterized protein with ACT and thioredoxin-like domain
MDCWIERWGLSEEKGQIEFETEYMKSRRRRSNVKSIYMILEGIEQTESFQEKVNIEKVL